MFCVCTKWMMPKEDLNDVKKHLKAAKGFDLYTITFFYSWFLFHNMAEQSSGFSFLQDIYVKVDISIYISISIRPIITKVGK